MPFETLLAVPETDGHTFTITVVAPDNTAALSYIDAAVNEIRRIEKLLTTFSTDSQTSRINDNAGIAPVVVDREVFDLIERSIAISKIIRALRHHLWQH